MRRPRLQPAVGAADALRELRAGGPVGRVGRWEERERRGRRKRIWGKEQGCNPSNCPPDAPHSLKLPTSPTTTTKPRPPLQQNVTWEGDNNVLCLQTARFMVKAMLGGSGKGGSGGSGSGGSSGGPAGSADYLAPAALAAELPARCAARSPDCWRSPGPILAALRHRAAALAAGAARALEAAGGGRVAFEGPAWNGSALALVKAARAHCELQLGRTFFGTLEVRAAAAAAVVAGVAGVASGLKQQQAASGKRLPPCFGRSAAFHHASLRITAPNVFPPAAKKKQHTNQTTTNQPKTSAGPPSARSRQRRSKSSGASRRSSASRCSSTASATFWRTAT